MSEFEQLRAFILTVEEGSISAAARRMGKAQSAVSTQISNMEVDLDIELFNRDGYRPELTEAGKSLFAYATNIRRNYLAFKDQVNFLHQVESSKFAIYIENGLMVDPIYQLFSKIAAQFPHLELILEQKTREQVIFALEDETADAAFITKSEEFIAHFHHLGIGHQRIVLCCHPDHPLAKMDHIDELELANHRSIGEHPHLKFKRNRKIYSPFYWQSTDLTMRINIIKSGAAFGLLPVTSIEKEVKNGELKILNFTFAQNVWLKGVGLLGQNKSPANPVYQCILDEVKHWDPNAWVSPT